jgi:hypothetical protein
MDLDFLPYNKPTFKGKIILPNDSKEYKKEYYNKKYYLSTDKKSK